MPSVNRRAATDPKQEHLASINRAVVEIPRPPRSPSLVFDTGAYWKARYDSSEAERAKLLCELLFSHPPTDREPDFVKPTDRDHASPSNAHALRSPAAAPAAGDDHAVSEFEPSRDEKEAELAARHARGQGKGGEPRSGAVGLPQTWAGQRTLVRAFVCLHRTVRSPSSSQASRRTVFRMACHALLDLIQQSNSSPADEATTAHAGLTTTAATLCKNIYPALLQCLKSVDPDKDGVLGRQAACVSDLVKVFQTLLGRLRSLVVLKCAQRDPVAPGMAKGLSSPDFPLDQASAAGQDAYYEQSKPLAAILGLMFTALDPAHDSHCELLEGLTSALLDHIGSALSLLVFADAEPTKGHDVDVGLLPPRGLDQAVSADYEAAAEIAKMEGPVLVWVLRRAMAFVQDNMGRMSAKSTSLFTPQCSTRSDGQHLRQRIEETLQKTLLRGVFGDDDPAFYYSLRRDDLEDEADADLTNMMRGMESDEGAGSWFIGQIWDILGWDILSGSS